MSDFCVRTALRNASSRLFSSMMAMCIFKSSYVSKPRFGEVKEKLASLADNHIYRSYNTCAVNLYIIKDNSDLVTLLHSTEISSHVWTWFVQDFILCVRHYCRDKLCVDKWFLSSVMEPLWWEVHLHFTHTKNVQWIYGFLRKPWRKTLRTREQSSWGWHQSVRGWTTGCGTERVWTLDRNKW